jgi:hypothetical protein
MESTTMRKTVRRVVIISATALIVSLAVSAFSAYNTFAAPHRWTYVPDTVGFEGQLANSSGAPVEGTFGILFTLYNASTGGTEVWHETQNVDVVDGLYSVQLGTVTSFESDDFSGPRWLGIKVGEDSEMTPRIPISAVPYALNAKQASELQGWYVDDSEPGAGEALIWNDNESQWEPGMLTSMGYAPETATDWDDDTDPGDVDDALDQLASRTDTIETIMPGQISARVYDTNQLSLGRYCAATTINFDSEVWDSSDIHSTASATSRLTAPEDGLYQIGGSLGLTTKGTIALYITRNGSSVIAGNSAYDESNTLVNVETIYELDANDYVTLVARNCEDNYRYISPSGVFSPSFWIVKIGEKVSE